MSTEKQSLSPVTERHWWLYVLECEQGKYYVGITSKTPEERFYEHTHKIRAAYWTMKYKPLSIMFTEDLGVTSKELAEKCENKVVREGIKKHGLNNVRGGDILDTKDYIHRFGYLFIKEDWKGLMYIFAILIMFAMFYVDKYIYSFIPGGIR